MIEISILTELLKQAPTVAALLVLVFKFLGALKEQRDECNQDRAADREARANERSAFLAALNQQKEDRE